MATRLRRVGSVSNELVKKSKEAALAAVQIFNNPIITFKSEAFIVLMNIAWTYLLHAHYRNKNIEYRYYKPAGKNKKFVRTKHGAFKFWVLERCLDDPSSPVKKDAANNLKFLIGLRHEIEHQMTTRIDDILSARFQACCLNYNECIKELFKDEGIEKHLSFSLQFSSINSEQKDLLSSHAELPANIQGFIRDFDENLSQDEFNSPQYAYRIFFVPKIVGKKGQADKVIEFVKADSPLAQGLNKEYALIKETERVKYLPKQILDGIKNAGYQTLTMHQHTLLWKEHDAKNSTKGYGVEVAGTWYWYQRWYDFVLEQCEKI